MIGVNRITVLLSVSVLFILALGMFVTYRQWDFDDSYIIYRIVKNILNGDGWVYNVGESHNASTSVLNTVLLTAVSFFVGNIRLGAHIIGGVSILASGLLGYCLYRRQFGNTIGLIAGFILIRKLAANETWGLEINLFICLMLLFVLLEGYRKNSWQTLGGLILTRPDGVLLVGLKWIKEFLGKRCWSVKGILTVLVICAPWIIFSVYKFGHILPDTFAQKLWQGNSGFWGTGHIYLEGLKRHYVLNSGLIDKVLVAIGAVGFTMMACDHSVFLYIIICAVLQQIAYIIFNVPVYHWYLVLPDFSIYLGVLYTLGIFFNIIKKHCVAGTESLIGKFFHLRPGFLWIWPILIAVALSVPAILTVTSGYMNPEFNRRDLSYTDIIKSIDSRYGPGRLATTEVGSIGFYTDRTVVDIVGLTSAKGHFMEAGRMDIFYSDPPELLLLHKSVWRVERSIYTNHRFALVYKAVQYFPDPHYPMRLYLRKENFTLSNPDAELAELYPHISPGTQIFLLNKIAWLMATDKNSRFYNPEDAIRIAKRAWEIGSGDRPVLLDTLAVAYASAGRFSEAVAIGEKALKSAKSTKKKQLIKNIENHLRLFKKGLAHIDSLTKAPQPE